MPYLDYLKSVLSWHYFEQKGEDFQAAIAKPLDALVDAAKQATTQRFWRFALDEALPYLLQNYNLDKVENFTPAQTRKQVAEAWPTWEFAGSEEGIIAEVKRLGYPLVSMIPVWLYQQRSDGTTDTIDVQPALRPDIDRRFWPTGVAAPTYTNSYRRQIATEGAWGSREWWLDFNFHYSSFFIVIHNPPFAFRRWGDPALWGKNLFWDALVTGDRVALRRLYITIKKFTPAEWSCRGVVFTYAGRYALGPVLLGLAVRSTYDIWACGASGYVTHFDGTAWVQVQTPTTVTLQGIFSTPAGEIYAVGRMGTILHRVGNSWQVEPTGTFEILSGFAYAGRELWVCGQNGTLLLNAGFGWVNFSSPTSANLIKLFALSPIDIWAVGTNGTALHYDGGSWTATTTGVSVDLYSVWGASSSEVWAVGIGGTILRWDGAAWNVVTSPTTANLFSVYGSADGKAIAVGDAIVVYDGTNWALGPASLTGERAWTVQGTVSDNFWTVTEQGNAYNLTEAGRVYTSAPWDNFSWDDGTRYDPKYLIKWLQEPWER